MTVAGRTAVITGAGRGIGEAIALAFADAGVAVLLAARTMAQVEGVATAIRQRGGTAHAVACDVTSEAEVAALSAAAAEHLGVVDILVNNAGIAHSSALHRTSLDDWNRVMAVNATGTFLCTRAFLPSMLEHKRGRVVNVASIAGLAGAKYIAAYTASKHAVIGLTRAVAADIAATGVTINAVCPGFVDTPMTDATIANVVKQTGHSREEALALVLASAHQQRLVTSEEVAQAVLSLCDVDAGHINGDALIIDGGNGVT